MDEKDNRFLYKADGYSDEKTVRFDRNDGVKSGLGYIPLVFSRILSALTALGLLLLLFFLGVTVILVVVKVTIILVNGIIFGNWSLNP